MAMWEVIVDCVKHGTIDKAGYNPNYEDGTAQARGIREKHQRDAGCSASTIARMVPQPRATIVVYPGDPLYAEASRA